VCGVLVQAFTLAYQVAPAPRDVVMLGHGLVPLTQLPREPRLAQQPTRRRRLPRWTAQRGVAVQHQHSVARRTGHRLRLCLAEGGRARLHSGDLVGVGTHDVAHTPGGATELVQPVGDLGQPLADGHE
jgi:hypothetical protein